MTSSLAIGARRARSRISAPTALLDVVEVSLASLAGGDAAQDPLPQLLAFAFEHRLVDPRIHLLAPEAEADLNRRGDRHGLTRSIVHDPSISRTQSITAVFGRDCARAWSFTRASSRMPTWPFFHRTFTSWISVRPS